MTPLQRQRFFEILKSLNPHPKTELIYASPFELLIAVILSAQATDVSVNRATQPLFAIANTPETILALGNERLTHFVRSIGLYKTKVKNILVTCEMLIRFHNSQVPRDRVALEALPGVGRKTANVVLNCIFGEPTIAVDTHIFRVSNRTKLAPGKTPMAVEQKLLKVVPETFKQHAHHWLILLGRYTCKARKPECTNCPVVGVCGFTQKNLASGIVKTTPVPTATPHKSRNRSATSKALNLKPTNRKTIRR